ncbi:MAG: NADP oxidoreductase [Rhizobiales bacterium PAR1]|nr:MAG: NADP oxidoreductase [Rhizobiales bacterium PAR1]
MAEEGAITVIGTGRIGSVLARAFDAAGREVIIAGRNPAAGAALAASCQMARCLPIRDAAAQAAILVLAVSPEACVPVLADCADVLRSDTIVVSLTNGVSLSALGAVTARPIVKLVPTLAQSVGRGAMPVMAGPNAAPAHIETVMALAALIGMPAWIDDADTRVASNVAGSALALVARFGEAFVAANAGRAAHLSSTDLTAMMAETFGAVSDLVARGHSFAELIAATATPGGVTEAQMAVLDADLPALCERIVDASFSRQSALQTESQARLT